MLVKRPQEAYQFASNAVSDDSLRQPGFWDINLSLRKAFNIPNSTHRFDLRIEAFNVLNRTRLGTAVTNPTLPDFGYITELTGNRTMQLGLQYVFDRAQRSG